MKILHLEDNPRDAALVRDMLAAEWPDCFISVVVARADFISLLKLGGYDLILSDYQLPGFNGLEALQIAREIAPDIPFVFFSGTLGEESAIDAVRSGAADYVIKDRMQRLPMSVSRVLREAAEQRTRRGVEQALAQEQYLLRLLMENLPAHVYFKDLHSAYLSVSRSKAQSHGLEPEQLKGKSDFEVFGPGHARRAFNDEQHIIATGENLVDVEERIVWPDGRISWMSATKLPLRDAAGKIIGTFGISHDITSRKESEARIREQAEIIDYAPVAILITDLNHVVTYCNSSACRLYGLEREQLMGRNHDELLTSDTVDLFDAGRAAALAGGHWTGEVPVSMRSMRQFDAELHLSAIKDAAGKVQACLCIAIDVTEKKKLEAQFLRAQRLESLGMLAAGIAHDLNNVLAPVLMGAPLLRSRMLSQADLQILESIENSAARGAALVRQILSFAHGAGGGGKALIQVKHLIRDISDLMKQTFPKSIRLDEMVVNNLWPLQGNPTQLHQVVLNLCVNARDAMPNGGVLRLRAENRRIEADEARALADGRPGNFVVVEVADTGTGIPADVLPRIWDPFFTTKGEGKGTGLGLSTVRGIVASHNGFVTLDTDAGKGTTFRVFLPSVDQTNQAQKGASGSTHPFLARGQGELVLLVDDEQTIRDLGVMILGRFGYRVLTAGNDREAMDLYTPRKDEVSLVITDLGMPGIGGAKLAAKLKELNPGVRVMFISGGDLSVAGEPAPAGSVMLPKPFTGEDLLDSVHRAIKAPA